MPAGTYVVRMDQPYRGYATDLLGAEAARIIKQHDQDKPLFRGTGGEDWGKRGIRFNQ